MTATPTPAPLLEEDLRPIRDALAAGPTPGPRTCLAGYGNHGLRIDSDASVMLGHVRAFIPSGEIRHGAEVQMRWEEGFANAALIAACYPERIARLLAHIAELDAKAKRYDYLRNMPVEIPSLGPEVTHWDGNGSGDAIRGTELDEAIDAQRAAIASEAKG